MIRPPGWIAPLVLVLLLPSAGVAGDARLEGIRVAPGWKVELAATEPLVINPVSLTFGPDGRAYVIEWKAGRGTNDRIRALRDRDGDGRFDEVTTFLEGLELPAGLLFWDGWTYLSLDHDVVRLRDSDGDGRPEAREVVVSGFPHNDSHHRVSGLTVGPDGWLYIAAADGDIRARGSDESFATIERSGGIFRCRPDGSDLQRFALGMRNPWGNVAFDAAGRMFHADNDSESTPDFTGCRLLHVVEGGDYGWRVRAGARCCLPDPERSTWDGGRPGRLGAIALTGRGAPTGVCVLDSGAFPPSIRSMLITPDVFRRSVRGYQPRLDGATFRGVDEVEILGSDDGRFRPSDAELGPDGALYVLDWRTDSGGASQLAGDGVSGRIYRLTWGGSTSEPPRPTYPADRFAAIDSEPDATLFDRLQADEPMARAAAARELARRVATPGPASRAIWDRASAWIGDDAKPTPARVALLNLAGGFGPKRGAPAINPTRFADPSLRRVAYASVRLGGSATSKPILTAMLKANETDPAVIREQALTLARVGAEHPGGESAIVRKLAALLDATRLGDDFIRDGVVRSLEAMGTEGREQVVRMIGDSNRTTSRLGRYALQAWRGDDAVGDIMVTATSAQDMPPIDRANLFLSLREHAATVPPDPIARWLVDQPRADLAPRVEAVRLLAAVEDRAKHSVDPIIVNLIDDPEPSVRLAAIAMAAAIRPNSARVRLIAGATSSSTPVPERVAALAALRVLRDRSLAPSLVNVLRKGSDATAVQVETLRTLAAIDPSAAAGQARELLRNLDHNLRGEAIAVLGQKPASALELVRALSSGTIPAGDSSRVIEAVRRHDADPGVREAMVTLLRDRLHAPAGTDDLARLEDQTRRLGNPTRGRSLFFESGRANCGTCHRVEGTGGSVGPDLSRLAESTAFRKQVESILEPSREIKEGYESYQVETRDGRVISGLLVADDPAGITLRDARGQEVRVAAGDVERKVRARSSLMPEGLVAGLSYTEFLDLLAFLGERRAEPAPPR